MRKKQFTPLKYAGQVIDEIDLAPDTAAGRHATAFTNFEFAPQLSLKNIHLPVLTPLVGMDVPGSLPEPIFDAAAQDDIQGNIIPGFNKDHQHFLFLRIRKPKDAKIFLREILPRISTMEEVIAFRRLYRSKRFLVGRHNTYAQRGSTSGSRTTRSRYSRTRRTPTRSAIAAFSSGWRSGRRISAIRRRHRTTAPRASGRSADPRTKPTSCSFWRRITSACSTTSLTW